MSSTYLTSDDMNLIERLLGEIGEHGPLRNFDRNAAARFLVQSFQRGATSEADLRASLSRHLNHHKAMDGAVARWDEEGGSTGNNAPAQRRP